MTGMAWSELTVGSSSTNESELLSTPIVRGVVDIRPALELAKEQSITNEEVIANVEGKLLRGEIVAEYIDPASLVRFILIRKDRLEYYGLVTVPNEDMIGPFVVKYGLLSMWKDRLNTYSISGQE